MITSDEKVVTVELDGEEESIWFTPSHPFIFIANFGENDIYASLRSGITPEADGVYTIPKGCIQRIAADRSTVYLYGTGKAEVQASEIAHPPMKLKGGGDGSSYTLPTMGTTVKGGAKIDGKTVSVTGDVLSANYSNENLLINPDFKINQRGKTGTLTETGYFADRWQLTSGSVTVNSDGSLTLNGTVAQKLENAAGGTVTASSSAGNASYDDDTNTFTLTASGETITWAKLEYGSAATPFTAPDPAAEIIKCMRFYRRVRVYDFHVGMIVASSEAYSHIDIQLPFEHEMRLPLHASIEITPSSIGNAAYMRTYKATGVNPLASTNNGLYPINSSVLNLRGVAVDPLSNTMYVKFNVPYTAYSSKYTNNEIVVFDCDKVHLILDAEIA